MIPVLFAFAAFSSWVPMRWPSTDAKSLDVLAGSAVNCVLVEAAGTNSQFLKKAAARHIVVLAVVHQGASAAGEAQRAARMKVDGVVLEGNFDASLDDSIRSGLEAWHIPAIALPDRAHIRLDTHDPIVGTTQALWPGIEVEHGGSVSTGPTSAPWINTNAGFARFVSAATNAVLWLGERPPPRTSVPVERYAIAIGDAVLAGARWIIALDDDLQSRLAAGDSKAIDTWKRIDAYVRYFEERPKWRDEYRPFGQFAVVQDAASGGLLSSGLLDMLAVQHTAARSLPTRRLSPERLREAHIVLNVDAATLNEQQERLLADFIAHGGKSVDPPPRWKFPPIAAEQIAPTRHQMDLIQPIWEATYFATARKNFGARTFNTSSVIFDLRATPDGKRLLIHLLNYADYAAEDIAVQVLGSWKHARVYRPGLPVKELETYPVKDGTGVDVDRIAVLGTIEID